MIKVNIVSKFLLCQFKWVSINEKYTELEASVCDLKYTFTHHMYLVL